ncbi:MAG: TlpA disulfide reductase family protein [Acidobacteriota bacterium]
MKRVFSTLLILAMVLAFNVQLLQGQTESVNLSFKTLDGRSVSLADLRGQVAVISFSAKGIPLMRYELPQLERLAAKFSDRGVTVFWVSTNSTRPKNQNYASDDELRSLANQYTHLTVLRDPDESAYRQLGSDALPTIIIIDQRGRLVGSPRTGIDPQANLVGDLAATLNRLLAE